MANDDAFDDAVDQQQYNNNNNYDQQQQQYNYDQQQQEMDYNDNNNRGAWYSTGNDDDFQDHAYELAVESRETSSYYFILFASLLGLVLILCKYLHDTPRISSYLSEAALILIVGMIAGGVANLILWVETNTENYQEHEEDRAFQRLLSFSPNIFFMALLPPILFNLGYQLRRELFYRHIWLIILLAAVGTSVSAVACAMTLYWIQQAGYLGEFQPTLLELFAFGALIAATDAVSVIAVLKKKRVDPNLFYIVFGESALNDAVALVLYNCFADLLREHKNPNRNTLVHFAIDFSIDAIGSPLIGLLWGFVAALMFLKVDMRKKENRMFEISLYLMMMYVPFIVAESMNMSGIVTVFFAGLSVRRYAAPNVSNVTEKAADTIFRLSAFLAETTIFLELGLSVFGFTGSFHWKFVGWSLLACLFGRAVAIYPLTLIHNLLLKRRIAIATNPNQRGPQPHWNFYPELCGEGVREYPRLCSEPFVRFGVVESPSQYHMDPPPSPETPKRPATPDTAAVVDVLDGNASVASSKDGDAPHATASTDSHYSEKSLISWQWKTLALQRDQKVTWGMAHILWFAGLRGAVAYACVRSFPDVLGHNDEFTAATMFIVLFTIIVMGGLTEPLLAWLEIRTGVDEDEYVMQWRRDHELRGVFHDFEKKYIHDMVVLDPSLHDVSSPPSLIGVSSAVLKQSESDQVPEVELPPVAAETNPQNLPYSPPTPLRDTPGGLEAPPPPSASSAAAAAQAVSRAADASAPTTVC